MIFHIDMDAFFASIEVVRNPSLRGKALIVGGNPERRGVVSTCSYEARKYGVRSAMSLAEAKRLCPHAIFLEGNISDYVDASRTIMSLFREITPYVQVMSIDEAYLDVSHLITGNKDIERLAHSLHRKIFETTQLTCSIGVATNKMLAKMASSHRKPNGLCIIPPGGEEAFLKPLPIQSIPGIGKKTVQPFVEEGWTTIEDIQSLSLNQLVEFFGEWGQELYFLVRGQQRSNTVHWLPRIPKSLSEERTFESDLQEKSLLLEHLTDLVEEAADRLQRKGMRAAGITLKLRDKEFRTFTRARRLFTHTQSVAIFQEEFASLFDAVYPEGMWIRLIGVTLERLAKEEWQPTLWNWEQETRLPSSTRP